MFKLMDKKIIQILGNYFCLSGPMSHMAFHLDCLDLDQLVKPSDLGPHGLNEGLEFRKIMAVCLLDQI